MTKNLFFNLLIFASILGLSNACSSIKNDYTISSPDNLVKLSLTSERGELMYQLHWEDQLMVDSSAISLMPNASVTIVNAQYETVDTIWQPVWGQFSNIRDYCNEVIFTLDIDGTIGQLFVRVYNQGIGFRFKVDSLSEGKKTSFHLEHKLDGHDNLFWPAGESEPKGPVAIEELFQGEGKLPKLAIPLVVEKENGKYLSILESDLYAAKGFGVMRLSIDKKEKTLSSFSKIKGDKKKITTPWRVILLGENPGELVTNTVTVNLATPCQLEDTRWIKPGKTLWDWRVHGYTAPDGFTYGINNESYHRFIDFAADKGIEYFLIDDSWYKHVTKGHFELSDELDLNEVIAYAADKGVELILYYDRKHGEYGDDALFPYYQSLGMKGIKYGFMGRNVDFSRDAIQKSGQSELLIDFHDGPVPFTGVRRTYPNAITREYCHAQQDSRRAFTPEAFIKMALINAIQGPLDMNNGNFDIGGINSGVRQKSPKKTNSYFSTVVSETARTLIIFSGLVCIPDAPEAYNAKPDLFEFIQKMPVGKWDESRIINSKMGEYITTARRHKKEWFIGSAINQEGGTLAIKFDFLEEGLSYDVTFYEDTEDTHCRTNPEAYQIRNSKIKKDDLIKVKLAPGGGHCMWIRPISKS